MAVILIFRKNSTLELRGIVATGIFFPIWKKIGNKSQRNWFSIGVAMPFRATTPMVGRRHMPEIQAEFRPK
jgi:hypothetical protein